MYLKKDVFVYKKRLNLEWLKFKYFNYKIAANNKICVKKHKYKTCKAVKQWSFINGLKN